jgi:sec-independent protein translocase protein TatA
MLGNIGTPELLVIFLIILLFFGSKKIPEFAKGLGQGIREFKKAMHDVEQTIHEEVTQKKQLTDSSDSSANQHSQSTPEH